MEFRLCCKWLMKRIAGRSHYRRAPFCLSWLYDGCFPSFFNKEFIKKQMDALAYYKLNRLHLHLTDAAGWRIEIKNIPV